jgi:hypothetical protein
MPVTDQEDDRIIKLVTEVAERFHAKIRKIDLAKQILDIDCPDTNKDECAVAIQKVLDAPRGSS